MRSVTLSSSEYLEKTQRVRYSESCNSFEERAMTIEVPSFTGWTLDNDTRTAHENNSDDSVDMECAIWQELIALSPEFQLCA